MREKHFLIALTAFLLSLILGIGIYVYFTSNTGGKIETASNNTDAITTIVKIGYRNHVAYTPLFVALEKGYFADEKIEVETVKFESTNQLMESLIAGRLDASLGGNNTFLLFSLEEKSPGEFKIISVGKETLNTGISVLLTKETSDVNSIENLKNKKIAIYPGSTARLLYRKIMSKYFNPEDAELIQMKASLELPALESGQVDAAIVLEPLASVAVNEGVAKIIDSSLFAKYFFDDFPLTGSVVSKELHTNNSELTKKIIRINDKAIEFIKQNTHEAKQILTKYTPLTEDIIEKVNLLEYQTLKQVDINSLQRLADLLLEEKELGQKIDVSKMIYD